MGIEEYIVERDKFEHEVTNGFIFPCDCCKHRRSDDKKQPCISCDHNSNAKRE